MKIGRVAGHARLEGCRMGSLSIWHWIMVIAVVLLLFGRGKISDLMGDVAQGIKAFKKGMQDDDKAADKPRAGQDHRPQCRADRGAIRRRQQGRLSQEHARRGKRPPDLRVRDWAGSWLA